ncbi:MAG: hypothetical protein LPK79_14050, partial [Bacteroidota bacterium]|nr:hypothetical protein [Bacteroidota bacterium]
MKDFGFQKSFDWVPTEERINQQRIQYGIWEFRKNKTNGTYELRSISRTGLNHLLKVAGFRKLEDNPEIIVQVIDSVLEIRTISDIKEFIKEYLDRLPEKGIELSTEEGTATKLELQELYFRQYHSVMSDKYLEHLHPLEKPILQDNRETAYLPFKNIVVLVNRESITKIPYSNLEDVYVWKSQIIPRDYLGEPTSCEGHFHQFILNVAGGNHERFDNMRSAIGYLLHNYSKPSMGQAVILYDEKITDVDAPQG